MIIYATKKTLERYNLKLPSQLNPSLRMLTESAIRAESGDGLLEWGAKLFYFDRRKCIQITNFASKFTLFLCDIKVADLPDIGNLLANYLFMLYKDNVQMCKCLDRLFEESPFFCFASLTNKSIIATLNRTQLAFAWDGDRFYDYIENNVLQTYKINYDVNFNWLFTQKINGETVYFYSGERFQELVCERYAKENTE